MQSSFVCTHSKSMRKVKGEDFVAQSDLTDGHIANSMHTPPYKASVFLIADGHGPPGQGTDCAKFIASRFPSILAQLLPPIHDPCALQEAMSRAFLEIDEAWSNLGEACDASGSTLTAILVTHSSDETLLTCASVGDSFSYMDTGRSIYELSANHRIDQNPDEAARLLASGCLVAKCGVHTPIQEPGAPGLGPRRVWPGGLVCSRSIGDIDAASEVIPVPHCRQVAVPSKGCRVIIASDGLWDALSLSEAITFSRSRNTADASTGLMRKAAMNPEVDDDCSVLIIDILPSPAALYSSRDLSMSRSESAMNKSNSTVNLAQLPNSPSGRSGPSFKRSTSFVTLAQELSQSRKASSSFLGIFACGAPDEGTVFPDARDEPAGSLGHVSTLSDVDAAVAQPLLLERYHELSSRPGGRRSGSTLPSADSTQHSGVSAFLALQHSAGASASPVQGRLHSPKQGWNKVAPVNEIEPSH